jgi:hypothetical protein
MSDVGTFEYAPNGALRQANVSQTSDTSDLS